MGFLPKMDVIVYVYLFNGITVIYTMTFKLILFYAPYWNSFPDQPISLLLLQKPIYSENDFKITSKKKANRNKINHVVLTKLK